MKKISLVAALLLLVGAGCSGGATTTTTTKVDPAAIRSHQKEIQDLAGGYLYTSDDPQTAMLPSDLQVEYGDVTGDGLEEAIVSVPSGGTAGVTNVVVYGLSNGKVKEFDHIEGYKMVAKANDGKLEINEYNPENYDPAIVTQEIYMWNGSKFEAKSSKDIEWQTQDRQKKK